MPEFNSEYAKLPALLYAFDGDADIWQEYFDLTPDEPIQCFVWHNEKQASFPARARISHSEWKKPQVPRFNFHYAIELGIVLSGKKRHLYIDGSEHDLEAGQAWFCNAWEPHGRASGIHEFSGLQFCMMPSTLAAMRDGANPPVNWLAPFTCSPDRRPHPTGRRREMIADLADRARQIVTNQGPYSQRMIRLLFQEILLTLMEDWETPQKTQTLPANIYDRLAPGLNMALERREYVPAQEAAEMCHMNRGLFSRLFREAFGVTFAQFALRLRLSCAAEQLIQENCPVKKAAFDWGFNSASHLSRSFQRQFGCAPGEYRDIHAPQETGQD